VRKASLLLIAALAISSAQERPAVRRPVPEERPADAETPEHHEHGHPHKSDAEKGPLDGVQQVFQGVQILTKKELEKLCADPDRKDDPRCAPKPQEKKPAEDAGKKSEVVEAGESQWPLIGGGGAVVAIALAFFAWRRSRNAGSSAT
jgi:hypothetical protein